MVTVKQCSGASVSGASVRPGRAGDAGQPSLAAPCSVPLVSTHPEFVMSGFVDSIVL